MSVSATQGAAHIQAWANTLNTVLASSQAQPKDHNNHTESRLALYRELIRMNLEDFVAVVFPIARTLIADEIWAGWMNDFAQSSYRKSSLFRDIAASFLEMLTHYSESEVSPGLLELMRWEWLEMAVEIDSEPVVSGAAFKKQMLNPTLRIESFNYPVHEMARQGALLEPKATVLFVWRTLEHEVDALCPDEAMLQLVLHLNEAESHENPDALNQVWEMVSSLPALEGLTCTLKQKDILV